MLNRVLLLGHRGTRSAASIAENTVAAFDRALEDGCDGFEFDVRLTRDGRAVVCHDRKCKDLIIAQAGENQLLELPTLPQVLSRYASRAFLDIELKVAGLEHHTITALKQHAPDCGYVVSSFLPEVLRSLGQANRQIPLGFICDREQHLSQWQNLPIQYVIPHHSLASKNLIAQVHAAEKKLFTWTVNKPTQMLRLAQWGVDGIISDDARLLVEILSRFF